MTNIGANVSFCYWRCWFQARDGPRISRVLSERLNPEPMYLLEKRLIGRGRNL